MKYLKTEFKSVTFLNLVTLDDVNLTCGFQGLRMVPRSVRDTINVDMLTSLEFNVDILRANSIQSE